MSNHKCKCCANTEQETSISHSAYKQNQVKGRRKAEIWQERGQCDSWPSSGQQQGGNSKSGRERKEKLVKKFPWKFPRKRGEKLEESVEGTEQFCSAGLCWMICRMSLLCLIQPGNTLHKMAIGLGQHWFQEQFNHQDQLPFPIAVCRKSPV